ncbi:DUF2785 domain-containing protein [Brevibacillus ginsengisoli]|uniref:DUF2785 domain-containing protein n=1 Tax=Brevibacillus ginsengisoli TaxID=363854 RepID=UPI003CF22283
MTSLKEQLISIQQNNYQAPPHIFEWVIQMVAQIGSLDDELRDDLIYSILSQWIQDGVLTDEELSRLVSIILDDQHLFYQIGENGTDSVFTRSFSVLQIPVLLIRHRNQPFLTKEQVHEIKTKVFNYLQAEKDLRGYVEGKGWAHAVAHGADALAELAQANELEKEDLHTILKLVRSTVTTPQSMYTDEEDERMVKVAIRVWQRNLVTPEEMNAWVRSLADLEGSGYTLRIRQVNTKSFLRSLYFRVKLVGVDGLYELPIEEVLRSQGRWLTV